ncbi:hypothetical protein ACIQ7Q_14410 [Streptomyces sp. NPDC096176]|uniref:SCO2400 family protein n=1 Tax=Streptomyces sp. NPDC096176 TaxID=3366079 RepID=UPI0038025FD6
MDYCHPCGRHLNGALACAGCGTPVEELRHHSPSAPEPDHVYELDVEPEPADRPGPRRSRRQAAPQRRKPAGRRARKRRGRKVLLGILGLVLAAGALSLAELAIEGSGDDGAATAVREEPIVESQTPEPTASDESNDVPDQVKEPAVTKSGSPRPGTSGKGKGKGEGSGGEAADGDGDGDGDGEGDGAKPSDSEPADGGSPSASSPDDRPDESSPSSTGEPPTDPGGDDPPNQENPPPPPEPTPTETCERWLFWCV